jgi:hypothetical protein
MKTSVEKQERGRKMGTQTSSVGALLEFAGVVRVSLNVAVGFEWTSPDSTSIRVRCPNDLNNQRMKG